MATSIGLPSISNLDVVKREEMSFPRRMSASTIAPLHPLNHRNHQSSTASAVPGPLGGLLSPPESRRTSGEDDGHRPPVRQSLPSIHEALGSSEQPHAFSAPGSTYPSTSIAPPAPTSAPQAYYSPSTTSPTDQRTRTYSADIHASKGPSNPFAQTQSPFTGPTTTTGPPSHLPPAPLDPRSSFSESRTSFSEHRPSFSAPQQNPKLPALHPLRTNPSPPPGPGRPSYSHTSNSYPPPATTAYEPPAPHSAGPMNPPYGYQQYPPNYPHSAPTPGAPNATYPPSNAYPPQRTFNGQWEPRLKEEKEGGRANLATYGESVKRHLESFDFEASLNEASPACNMLSSIF